MFSDHISSLKLRRTAAEVLAATLYELFPNVELLGGDTTHSGFYYDFIFPHPQHEDMIPQIEEKMRQIIREEREIRDIEMVGVSAKEFLKSKGLHQQAARVSGDHLFQIVQIGPFTDLASGDHLASLQAVKDFKLLSIETFDSKKIRIQGVVFFGKDALKKFLKKKKAYQKTSHEYLATSSHYFLKNEEGITWLIEGIKAKEKFTAQIKKSLYPSLEVQSPEGVDVTSYHLKLLDDLKADAILEERKSDSSECGVEDVGLFEGQVQNEILLTTFLKNSISLLQSIQKVLIILDFSYRLVYFRSRSEGRDGRFLKKGLESLGWDYEVEQGEKKVSRLDFLVSDALGREWVAASILEDIRSMALRMGVERNLALLLELQRMNKIEG